MKNTKLVKLLKSFSKAEIVKLRDYINSPYFNKNRNVAAIGEEVLGFYPDFGSGLFTEEKIHKKIFPHNKFDYFKFKNYFSDLYQLAISFLKLKAVEKKEYENEISLLDELHERKLDLIYSQKESKVSGHLDKALIKNEQYYFLRHQLGKINTSHYKFKKTGYSFNQIQNEFDTFLDYSLIGMLRLYSKMLHNMNHGNISFNMEMFENIWDYVKDKDFDGNPSCQIYKQTILLELTKDEKEYRRLLELKEKYKNNMPIEDTYYILLIINSFAAYRLNLGDETYHRDRFISFKEQIDRNFFQGSIIYPNFITTFAAACMVGEFEWAEDFKKRFQGGIIPTEEKLTTLNYCRGFLAYRMKEYDTALGYFAKTNFKLFLFKVMVRSYTARIFYEQNMYEQTLSAADTFRHYLRTEKLMAEPQKNAHYDFIKYISRLAELKAEGFNKKKSIELQMLKKQIEQMESNPLGAKNWLLEKANELK